jgi:mono/diheme cytochrome c family protein
VARAAPRAASCAALEEVGPKGRGATSSAVVLPERRARGARAYVADPDSLSIATVDIGSRALLGAAASSGAARELLVLPSGHVIASLEHASHLDVFAPTKAGPLELRCSVEVPRGPAGMALSEDGATLAVTSRTASAVTFLDARTFEVRRVVSVPRAPSGALFVGEDLWVSHLVGPQVTRIGASGSTSFVSTSLEATKSPDVFQGGVFGGLSPPSSTFDRREVVQRGASQAFALVRVELARPEDPGEGAAPTRGAAPAREAAPRRDDQRRARVVVPMVSVDPGDERRETASYYGPPATLGVPKQSATAFGIDATAGAPLTQQILGDQASLPDGECLLPRAAAFDTKSERLFVTCLGSARLLQLDARSVDPMRALERVIETPRGPTGVAIAEEERLAIVVGAFDGVVSIVDLAADDHGEVALSEARSEEALLQAVGRDLFYRTNDRRVSFDGLSCASCHVDGEDDGLTWQTPDGPRQTLSLAGRVAGSAPYGWSRRATDAHEYVSGTISRLGGAGLTDRELDALVGYVHALPAPPPEVLDAAAVAEGERIFVAQGCASCHPGGETDRRAHRIDADEPTFDSPSLRRVGLSAPYFHDGRYRSLRELLADPKSPMGDTKSLRPHEIPKLELYLRSL